MEEEQPSTGKLLVNFLTIYWKSFFVIFWPILCLPIVLIPDSSGLEGSKFRCLYCVALMAGFWVTECVPLAITGLMPMFLFPVLNIMGSAETSICYFKEVNMVFMGGLLLAIAVENSNLHNRIALLTIMKIGCSPRLLHLGLLIVAMLMSMWLVNSATTAMFCPIIKAILEELEAQGIGHFYDPPTPEDIANDEPPRPSKCTICFYLGVAYASSIGGLGTLVGTPTNLAFKGTIEEKFPEGGVIISFVMWVAYNFPIIFIITILSWLWLQILYLGLFRPKSVQGILVTEAIEKKDAAYEVMKVKYKELGSISWHEAWVGILFLVCMVLWFFRAPQFITGWGDLVAADFLGDKVKKKYIKDSVPALFTLFLMIIVPAQPAFFHAFSKDESKRPTKASPGLVTWKVLEAKMAWGAIFLLGGGFAIASAGEKSGASKWLGEQMSVLKSLNAFVLMCFMTIFASILTEMTSNTAICNIVEPVILSMAVSIKTNPLYLGVPAAIACSFAFMLPVGTPANTIIAGYANIRTKDMAIGGSVVKIIALAVTLCIFPVYGMLLWKVNEFPDWANADLLTTTTTTEAAAA